MPTAIIYLSISLIISYEMSSSIRNKDCNFFLSFSTLSKHYIILFVYNITILVFMHTNLGSRKDF